MFLSDSTASITKIIIDTINTIFTNIFSSIDNNLYSILDNIVFIDTDIMHSSYFNNIFGTSTSNGILLIANSLIVGFVLYYCIKLMLSNLGICQVQTPISFIFKVIFFAICMNSSFFICEQLIFLNYSLSSAITGLGQDLFKVSISFQGVVDKLNAIIHIEENSLNIFSIDGILKSVVSVSFLNLAFSYSVRYIMLKVLILISPFAILCLCLPNSSGFFKSWLRCFLSMLFIQDLVAIVLVIIFSLDFKVYNLFSKFLICGGVFTLIKANSYVKEFMGGFSTDFSSGINGIRNIIKS